MNEAKHTPGPFFTTCPHGGTIYVEARLRGSTIQEVAAVGPTETPEQQYENAKLFVAAPDLLRPQRTDMARPAHHLPAFRDDDADQQRLLHPAEVSRLTYWNDRDQLGGRPCPQRRR